MQTVTVEKPFVGAYKCSIDESDFIQDELVENDKGEIVTRRVPYKRVVGLMPQRRLATPDDQEKAKAGHLYVDGSWAYDSTEPMTITVPVTFAAQLSAKGLAKATEVPVSPAKKHLKPPA